MIDRRPILRVAVTSRALFDLAEEDAVFREEGLDAYRALQRRMENAPLDPGTAFPLVQKLLNMNGGVPEAERLVDVILASRNTGITSHRISRAIEAHGLAVTRRILTGGRPVVPYLKALDVGLFLSADPADVETAVEARIPAAIVMPTNGKGHADAELRVAFDGDCCLFDGEAQAVFDAGGLEAFSLHEHEHREEPMGRGPMAGFLESLAALQSLGMPIRTALVTARSAPAHERPLRTLAAWGVQTDEFIALGGEPKAAILKAFGADIFFDDSERYVVQASPLVPSARVPSPKR